MAKSKIIDGFSYEYNNDGNLVGIFNHADPSNPVPLDPNGDAFNARKRTDGAITAYNFNKHGGDKGLYGNTISEASNEELNEFYDRQIKDNKSNLKETQYPDQDNNISNLIVTPKPPATSAYAAYKDSRGKKVGTDLFTYPLDIDPQQDHLKISKYTYKRNEQFENTGTATVNASQPPHVRTLKMENTKGEKKYNKGVDPENKIRPVTLQKVVEGGSMLGSQLEGSVMLPMPKVVDTNGCEWGESEVNIFGLTALAGAEVGKKVLGMGLGRGKKAKSSELVGTSALEGVDESDVKAVQDILTRAERGGKLFKTIQSGASAIGNAFVAEATARVSGQSVSQDQVLARTSGRVLNPNAELLFQGPVLRDFNFDFLMIARSEKEGKEIRKIIRWFKSGMAPKFNNSTFLKTPDVFTLQYRKKNTGGEFETLKTVNRFSPGGLALRTIAVDYAVNGYWSAYQDSQPVAIKMSLNFAELRPIYAQDQNQNELIDSVGY
tara:strand:+ start:169 stop:1647 length:1479 start_codon:yes stop_codon:yes gene_type:complete